MRAQLFRIAGDFCHLASKFILMVSIHRNRSAEGMPDPDGFLLFSRMCATGGRPRDPGTPWLTGDHIGVSFITQVLYCVVFLARYTDLFGRGQYVYNIIFKIFYILSSFYIIGLMQWVFPRSREKELAWKLGAACFFGALLLSPFTMLIFQGKDEWSMFYVSYLQSPGFVPASPPPSLGRRRLLY
jgi:hypothetical protein